MNHIARYHFSLSVPSREFSPGFREHFFDCFSIGRFPCSLIRENSRASMRKISILSLTEDTDPVKFFMVKEFSF